MLESLESLTDAVSASPVTYLVVHLLVAGDAIVPLFPGESAVVAGAALAADGDLVVWLIGLAAFLGAVTGDLVGYVLGRWAGTRLVRRFVRGAKGRRALEGAQERLERRGVSLIAAAQFIPGGRNVMMIAAGTLEYPLPRFLVAEVIGAAAWALFQTSLGYFGGKAFDSTLVAIGVSIGIAIAIGVALEGVERLRRRRAGGEGEPVSPPAR